MEGSFSLRHLCRTEMLSDDVLHAGPLDPSITAGSSGRLRAVFQNFFRVVLDLPAGSWRNSRKSPPSVATPTNTKPARPAILVGSTFPLSLVRRPVRIAPNTLGEFRKACDSSRVCSFWGHGGTLALASELAGHNLTPSRPRPALQLDGDCLPTLDGQSFSECWVLSPNYVAGFRPEADREVPAQMITGWQVLKMTFQDEPV